MGHSSITVTETYLKPFSNRKIDEANQREMCIRDSHAVVGEGAIVAAGSLVLSNTVIEPGSIWGGAVSYTHLLGVMDLPRLL